MKPTIFIQANKRFSHNEWLKEAPSATLRYFADGYHQPPTPEVSLSVPHPDGGNQNEILEFTFPDGERWSGTFAELQHALKVAKHVKDFEESIPWAGHVEGLLTDERRQDMLVGALEGGSNYWYLFHEVACEKIETVSASDGDKTFVDRLWAALQAGFDIPVHDVEEEEQIGSISMTRIIEGEKLMREKHPHHWADILKEQDDASTADVWFQMVVLKELVYG